MRIEKHVHDNTDERLWGKIGCYLVTPAIHKALGGYVVSNQDCTWWIALDENDQAIGFCMARRHKNGKVVLTYAYVVPEHRGTGLYEQLFDERLREILSWPDITLLESAVNDRSDRIFLDNGFVPTDQRGDFMIMQREVR